MYAILKDMTETATLAGGCYWCLEAIYQRVEGITSVVSGYSGGHVPHVTVQQVYDGGTGHAEVVQLEFDPSIVLYRELLEIFFTLHDPTTPNRQGNDIGEIYRSAIFYHSEEQRQVAQDMIEHFAADLWPDPIVTQLEPFKDFWPADESMQDYFNRNPNAGYCMVIINPKVVKLREKFSAKLKPTT